MTTFKTTGGQTYRLGSSIGSTDTSILLSSFLEPISNTPYTMAVIGSDIVYGTISPQSAQSEFISFSGITQNADGTALLTGVVRGLPRSPATESPSSTFKLPHPGQSVFIISDAPQVFDKYAARENDETITGQWTFDNFPITPSNSNASTTVKGVTKLSVAPVSSTNPIAAGDNDPRLTNAPSTGEKQALAGTAGTPSSSNKYVTHDDTTTTAVASKIPYLDASGFIPQDMLGNRSGSYYAISDHGTTPTNAATITITHNLGVIPKMVKLTAFGGTSTPISCSSVGVATVTSGGVASYTTASFSTPGGDVNSFTDSILYLFIAGGANFIKATLGTFTTTTFVITFAVTGSAPTNWSYVCEVSY